MFEGPNVSRQSKGELAPRRVDWGEAPFDPPESGPDALAFDDTLPRDSGTRLRKQPSIDTRLARPTLLEINNVRRTEHDARWLQSLSPQEIRLRIEAARDDLSRLAQHHSEILQHIAPIQERLAWVNSEIASSIEKTESEFQDSYIKDRRSAVFGNDVIEREAERILQKTDPQFLMRRTPQHERGLQVDRAYHFLSDTRPELRAHADEMMRQYHDRKERAEQLIHQTSKLEQEKDILEGELKPYIDALTKEEEMIRAYRLYLTNAEQSIRISTIKERRAQISQDRAIAIDNILSAHWMLEDRRGSELFPEQERAYTALAKVYLNDGDSILDTLIPFFLHPPTKKELKDTLEWYITIKGLRKKNTAA